MPYHSHLGTFAYPELRFSLLIIKQKIESKSSATDKFNNPIYSRTSIHILIFKNDKLVFTDIKAVHSH